MDTREITGAKWHRISPGISLFVLKFFHVNKIDNQCSELLVKFSFKKMHFKMLSAKWWPFCLSHNVLKHIVTQYCVIPLQWRHNEYGGVSNHRRLDCSRNRLFRRRSKKISKLRVTGLCEGNSPVNSPHKRSSNAENVSIWWRHHVVV